MNLIATPAYLLAARDRIRVGDELLAVVRVEYVIDDARPVVHLIATTVRATTVRLSCGQTDYVARLLPEGIR